MQDVWNAVAISIGHAKEEPVVLPREICTPPYGPQDHIVISVDNVVFENSIAAIVTAVILTPTSLSWKLGCLMVRAAVSR